MYKEEKTLDLIAIEIGGIANTLFALSVSFDPVDGSGVKGQVIQSSLIAMSAYCERLQEELDAAHMRLEVKPLNQTA